jgi:Icc-related predicted phosphoesterase
MKILALSDAHKDYRKVNIPKADILIFAGDIDVYKYDQEFNDFNDWLGSLKQIKHKIVIAGNHDGYFEDRGYQYIKDHLTNATYLENSGIIIDGIKFYGSPITPTFLDWSFMKERGKAINEYWSLIPRDIDILITHGPAFGILDTERTGKSVGCEDLLKRVLEIKPKIHIFGHIHASYGHIKTDYTDFYNVSVMNEDYDLVNKPTEIIYERQ